MKSEIEQIARKEKYEIQRKTGRVDYRDLGVDFDLEVHPLERLHKDLHIFLILLSAARKARKRC